VKNFLLNLLTVFIATDQLELKDKTTSGDGTNLYTEIQ